jgi:hypothetical protein
VEEEERKVTMSARYRHEGIEDWQTVRSARRLPASIVIRRALLLLVGLWLSGQQAVANDFDTRKSAPGVFRYFDFDSQAEADPHIRPPWNQTVKRAKIVTDVRASGLGSLRFEVPSNSPSDSSGSFWLNFADDLSVQFGEGDEFFVQWRQRFSPEFLNAYGGQGWKQAIIGEGDRPGEAVSSCTQLEIVMNCDPRFMGPTMYHSCGGKDGRYEGLDIWDDSLGNFVVQNAVDCLYPGFASPPCVKYKSNQWITYQVQIKIGTWYKNDGRYRKDSTIRMWMAEEGKPAVLLIDRSPESGTGYDIANNDAANALYGKIWFLPYNTNKDSSISHPTAYTWYDELILSRQRIPDPVPGSEEPPVEEPPVEEPPVEEPPPPPPPPDDGGDPVVGGDPAPPAESDSVLGNLVAQMKPGEWKVLNTKGYGFNLLEACDGYHSILAWANTGEWYADAREFHFIGQGHYACQKHIVYNVMTNTWTTLPLAQTPEIGHGYEHNALDPATGDYYYREWNSTTIMKRTRATGSWSELPNIPGSLNAQVASAIDWFPELGTKGSLVFVDSVAGIWAFDAASRTWNELSDPLPMGDYNIFSAYNPAHAVVLFGGGNGSFNVYKLDSSGRITSCKNSPIELGIARAVVEFEPNTGKYLAFANSGQLYQYDVASNAWSLLGSHPVMTYARDWRVASALSTYGVIFFITWDYDNSKVLLYKHADGVVLPPPQSDTVAPNPPVNLRIR